MSDPRQRRSSRVAVRLSRIPALASLLAFSFRPLRHALATAGEITLQPALTLAANHGYGWHSFRRAFANRLGNASLRDLKDLGGWKTEQPSSRSTNSRASRRNATRFEHWIRIQLAHGTATRTGCHKKQFPHTANARRELGFQMGPGGVEPPTSRLSGPNRQVNSPAPCRFSERQKHDPPTFVSVKCRTFDVQRAHERAQRKAGSGHRSRRAATGLLSYAPATLGKLRY